MSLEALNLLVIDDDDVGREMVRRFIDSTDLDVVVHEAGSALEGSQRLAAGNIDCALLDYHLGDGTGFEMIENLRRDVPGFSVPIILLTGAGSEEVAVKALKLGINDYINKDRLDAEGLDKAIRTTMAEHRLARAEHQHRQALEYQSLHDELTGMPNRRLFLDRLEQRILGSERQAHPFALLNIDLDMFKSINDTLGHGAGDDVLRVVGDRLAHLGCRSDTYARMGGDEFAVLLSGSDSIDGAITVAQKIAEVIVQPIKLDGDIVTVDASIGIAMYPDHGRTSKLLMAHADEAMYVAKRSARHFSVFTTGGDEPLHENAKISMEIPALTQREHVALHYQPKYDLRTGEIVGVEALARWQHPELGAVSPDKFIPILERSKFINEFTDIVFEMALDQSLRWRSAGIILPVAVNVSPRALAVDDFADHVLELLSGRALDPGDLNIEITETASLRNYDRSATELMRLAEKGVGISIDDFGTGYTSIRYLRDFSATELKIDRLFVAGVADFGRDYSIVSGIVRLAQGIGARTVAEGVESAETLRALVELGCDCGQGFYLGYPRSVERLAWENTLTRPMPHFTRG